MSHITSVRETVYSIQSDSLKYMKKIMDVSHKKKLKHQRRGVTVVNCGGQSRTTGFVQEQGVRPGAREESASPAWPATSAKKSHIYFFFLPCYICHYIVILCKNIRVDSKFKAIAPMAFRKK